MNDPTLLLTQALIACPSVTPDDSECQSILIERLKKLNFQIEQLDFAEVKNVWARLGEHSPLVVFAGHTDVVPPGPIDAWHTPPFVPTLIDDHLYGRGAADMKASLAAFITAIEAFLARHAHFNGSIGLLITGDEEGPSVNGTAKVLETLSARGEVIDYCIVGEPTSEQQCGDTIKNGRRGSLTGKLTVKGIQGHIAYPHLANNPIHRVAPVIAELAATEWDQGNQYFPPTTWQISNIKGGTGAGNVIPGEVEVLFNFRFSPENTADSLKNRVESILNQPQLYYTIEWTLFGEPYLTSPGKLTTVMQQAIQAVTGIIPKLSTSGGTSDGRFIAKHCQQVIEFGPLNATIHQANECIKVAEINHLSAIYLYILQALLVK